jgi:hypothetical protein
VDTGIGTRGSGFMVQGIRVFDWEILVVSGAGFRDDLLGCLAPLYLQAAPVPRRVPPIDVGSQGHGVHPL